MNAIFVYRIDLISISRSWFYRSIDHLINNLINIVLIIFINQSSVLRQDQLPLRLNLERSLVQRGWSFWDYTIDHLINNLFSIGLIIFIN